MITKKQCLDSLIHEVTIVKHLTSKLKPEMGAYKPAPGMRSTLEVLHYLSSVGVAPLKALLNDNWGIVSAHAEQAASLTLADMPAALDKEIAELKEVFAGLTEDKLMTTDVTFPWGGGDKLGIAIVNTCLKFVTAYKMQLFVYAKSQGLSELNTASLWAGIDAKM